MMERLSERLADVIEDCVDAWSQQQEEIVKVAISRLAHYENTGLTPDELDDFTRQACEIRMAAGCTTIEDCYCIVRSGRLVVLPCKVGDTVYEIFSGRILEREVASIIIQRSFIVIYCGGSSTKFNPSDFGKTVFHTREEAEKYLSTTLGNHTSDELVSFGKRAVAGFEAGMTTLTSGPVGGLTK